MTDSAPLPPSIQKTASPAWVWWLAAAMILGQAVLAWTATRSKSMTIDEIAHLTGGVALWQGDQRLVPENGNLPQRIGALPAVRAGAILPPPDSSVQQAADVWRIGHQAWFKTPGQNHWPVLSGGRAVMTIFLMGVGAMVFWWSRRWWGDAAGLRALAVATLSPTALAHGALITSDMAAALLLPLSAGLFWWHLHRNTWVSLTLTCLAVGLACVAKFSAVLLAPTFLLLDLLWLRVGRTVPLRIALAKLTRDHLIIVAAVMATIWTFHGWRYQPVPGGSLLQHQYAKPWEVVLTKDRPARKALLTACRDWKIFPEAYTYGAAYMTWSADRRLAFLNGEIRRTGWRHFFPVAFGIKTPLVILVLACLGAGTILVSWKRRPGRIKDGLYCSAPLLIWTAIYTAVTINSHLNIGHRHLLPIYPGLFILCGAAVHLQTRGRPWIIGGLTAALALISFQIRPHYLAYFNELVGGPSNGYKHLVDSSLDWGQDLPGLAEWLRENNQDNKPVYLSYFGTSDPYYYGINAYRIGSGSPVIHNKSWFLLKDGYYALSATMLQLHNYGRWSTKRENSYRALRVYVRQFENRVHDDPAELQEFLTTLNLLSQERMSRLCHVLASSDPIAHIGHSILIFHLTEEEAQAIDFAGSAGPADEPEGTP